MYRVTADRRQHFTDDTRAEHTSYTKPLGALVRDAAGKTVCALLSHRDIVPVQGHVREWQNVMERAVILTANGVLCPQVPAHSPGMRSSATRSPRVAPPPGCWQAPTGPLRAWA